MTELPSQMGVAVPAFAVIVFCSGMVTGAEAGHPLASLMEDRYGPEGRSVKEELAWKLLPSMVYNNGSWPPIALMVIFPSLLTQEAGEMLVPVSVGPGLLPMDTVAVPDKASASCI